MFLNLMYVYIHQIQKYVSKKLTKNYFTEVYMYYMSTQVIQQYLFRSHLHRNNSVK